MNQNQISSNTGPKMPLLKQQTLNAAKKQKENEQILQEDGGAEQSSKGYFSPNPDEYYDEIGSQSSIL